MMMIIIIIIIRRRRRRRRIIIQEIDKKAWKVVSENGGKAPLCMTRIRYFTYHEMGGGGGVGGGQVYFRYRWDIKYKSTKIKSVVRLYGNEEPAIQMVRQFEERAEEMGRRSMVKNAFRITEELPVSS